MLGLCICYDRQRQLDSCQSQETFAGTAADSLTARTRQRVGMVDLKLTLGRLALKNPVLVASGTFGYVREMEPFVRLERLGGVIPKTVTFQPRAGNPTPRTVETASGLLNAIGLDNDGIEHFIEHHLPYLRTVGTAVIANIAGEDEDQFVAMAEMLGTRAGPGGDRAEHLVPERQPRA